MATVAVTDETFDAEVKNSDIPVVVDFWAEWCGPCKQIGPALEELSNEMEGQIKVVKVDVDNNPNSPAAMGVRGIPALFIFKDGQVISNRWLRNEVSQATVRVSEGSSLQSALQASGYFPPMMLYMIASGESSGELDGMLARVAKYLQQDLEALLATLLSLIGPMMLIIMGGAVFTIVMAILLPIINLNQMVA